MVKGILIAHSSLVIEERHELFTLAVLTYLYVHSENHPKPGHDIAALIAWDVENVEKTPEFVIDCNRNFEKQGGIFHAEMMTIEKALHKTQTTDNKEPEDNPKEHFDRVKKRLSNTTLYASLEPCPFCTMGISWVRIPKVIYFMDDPGMRDCETYTPIISFPQEFFIGRQLTSLISSKLPLATEINQDLKEIVLQDIVNKYVILLPNGKKLIDLDRYLVEKGVFKSAHDQFFSFQIKYSQNNQLFRDLQNFLRR